MLTPPPPPPPPHLPFASEVGRRVSKHFPGFGRYGGKVVGRSHERGYSVQYEDGDTEDLSQADVLRLLQTPSKHKRARGAGGGQRAAKAAPKASAVTKKKARGGPAAA